MPVEKAAAIMALDVGQTTGVAIGIFSSKSEDPILAFQCWELHAEAIEGDQSFADKYRRSAMRLYQQWQKFRYHSFNVWGVRPLDHHLTYEDFIASPNAILKRDSLSPVYMTFLLEGIRDGAQLGYERRDLGPAHRVVAKFSSPSNKSAVANPRLRTAGFWIKGSDHKRDATRHLLLTAKRLGFAGVLQRRERLPPPVYRPD